MKKKVKEAIECLNNLPVQVIEWSRTGKGHYKISLKSGSESHFFIISGTGSDVRELKNFRGEVTKWLRNKGIYGVSV